MPCIKTESLESDGVGETTVPIFFELAESDVVVGSLGARDTGLNCGQIQLENAGVLQIGVIFVIFEKSQCAQVLLGDVYLLLASSGLPEICQCFLVNWEQSDGSSIFWSHIADGGAIGKAQIFYSWAIELHKFIDNSLLPQHLRAEQHQISGSRSPFQLSAQLETDHLRKHHRCALTQHHSLCLDPAHPPTHHTQTVDHRCMRICPHDAVRIQKAILIEYHSCQILQVDLMYYAKAISSVAYPGGTMEKFSKADCPHFKN